MRTPSVTLVPTAARPTRFDTALGRILELVVLSIESIRDRWLARTRG